MKYPWSPRYQAVIVGQESGYRAPVSFMQWRTENDAAAWCARMNRIHGDCPLTVWEYEEIDG